MPKRPTFTIILAPEVEDHLVVIERKYLGLLRREINEQLTFRPLVETRNRKPLEQPAPFSSTWELRCGPDNRFRVFYDVDIEENVVSILAIGLRDRTRLTFGGEEYQS